MLAFNDFIKILFDKIIALNLYTQVTWCTLISLIMILLIQYIFYTNNSQMSKDFIKSF
jgi:hypothetical protein